eukprot:TRINITY_DN3979_c0_g1_i3.p1 TRINITY_DN3979_c0_g1~~TRINITY_DN3979_c0_g1_i3.p1  ORF type:complete len:173 (+),score=28.23 TRINITY_DN3979_c0_g1_i3:42-560(+)
MISLPSDILSYITPFLPSDDLMRWGKTCEVTRKAAHKEMKRRMGLDQEANLGASVPQTFRVFSRPTDMKLGSHTINIHDGKFELSTLQTRPCRASLKRQLNGTVTVKSTSNGLNLVLQTTDSKLEAVNVKGKVGGWEDDDMKPCLELPLIGEWQGVFDKQFRTGIRIMCGRG